MEYPKYKDDKGRVAIIYTPDFGAGWYSWNTDYPEILTDPKLVKLILEEKEYSQYIKETYPNVYYSDICKTELDIEWVPEGTSYRIQEYDGAETVVLFDEEDFHIA